MNYPNIHMATFLARPNRFVAQCQLAAETVTVHVKNTGRGAEVFLPGVEVGLVYDANPKRKTHYDLVTIKKDQTWFNIDSQLPNNLVDEGLKTGVISLPGMSQLTKIKREVTYLHSKFDFYLEDDQGQKAFLEVKGMTLEKNHIGAFPDAPTLRGLKHVEELRIAQQDGFKTFVVFIAQAESIFLGTIFQDRQPDLQQAIQMAQAGGTQVLCYNCHVTVGGISLKEQIPFQLDYLFKE
ncbi:DNA/RNA nuclease SfsA [Enterococcus timonensis]|uniref:DNA/RNA nuclease SfsA n=1 Tax=Enterococcus timonensis TaxID=1852364 RepID=UPI0008D8EA8F|nr:DNA/RNA nuclease SfsA [Enterococcus timonensis]